MTKLERSLRITLAKIEARQEELSRELNFNQAEKLRILEVLRQKDSMKFRLLSDKYDGFSETAGDFHG